MKPANSSATWAHQNVDAQFMRLAKMIHDGGCKHWSRAFEYPWALINGDFRVGMKVLDAAGGDAPFQAYLLNLGLEVTNVDLAVTSPYEDVKQVQGDLKNLPFTDGCFDRVTCLSVLEHIESPEKVLPELWRVLRPGGKLLVTFDVADYVRFNHTIDLSVAQTLLDVFGLEIPPRPDDVLRCRFDEDTPTSDEPATVDVYVLCFWVEKPG